MSSQNMFTPAFGGMPQVFFGRDIELGFVRSAMDNPNSPHKAFFITGNRGCGKTTLLERMSMLASKRKWIVVDVHSAHAAQAVVEVLAGGSEKTVEHRAEPSAFGVTLGAYSSALTTTYSPASLGQLLVESCRSLPRGKGILITVDEVQKVPEDDAENLCAGVQIALRKGLPIMLALAGLPGSKEKVSSYNGCTFMQRAYDMKIGSLQVDETIDAFRDVFGRMPEYRVSDDALWEAGLFSQGYPYLMQLLGYHVVELAKERNEQGQVPIDIEDIRAVEPIAFDAYRENVLEPILGHLPQSLSSYLKAMCDVEDDQGRVSTGGVAHALGMEHAQVSSFRKRLINSRLIEPDGYGYVRFLLPHIRDYYQRDTLPLEERDPLQQWNRYR